MGDSCDGVDDSNSSDDAVGSDGVSDDWDCSLMMMVIVVLMIFIKMVMNVCMLIMMVKLLVI